MTSRDQFIALERQDLNNSVAINIQTTPDIGASHIVIPPVPKKQKCDPATEVRAQFGRTYQGDLTQNTSQLLVDSDDGHGHKYFTWNVNIESAFPDGKDGVISGMSCTKYGSQMEHYEIEHRSIGVNTATCKGWWQEANRQISMHVTWYKKGFVCHDIEWQKKP